MGGGGCGAHGADGDVFDWGGGGEGGGNAVVGMGRALGGKAWEDVVMDGRRFGGKDEMWALERGR